MTDQSKPRFLDSRHYAALILHEMSLGNLSPELVPEEYEYAPPGSTCVCPDILAALPVMGGLLIARDTIHRGYADGAVNVDPVHTNERFSRAIFAALFYRFRLVERPPGPMMMTICRHGQSVGMFLVPQQ